MKKIAIIGAGPGGLTSAMILAKRGFQVEVFESKDKVGGRNAAIKLGDYTFDTGPTFLMMRFILEEMFQEAGKDIYQYLKFKKLDPLYSLLFTDKTIQVSADTEKMLAEIKKNFQGNEEGLIQFKKTEGKRFQMLYPCIQRDYSSLKKMISPKLIKALPYLAPHKSVFQNLGEYFNEEKLRLTFSFQSKYLGMSPWNCPAFFTMLSYIEHRYGIDHVEGGLNQISEAMAKAAIENGAKIYLNTPVKSLKMKGKKIGGLLLEDGKVVLADEFIINADFGYAMSHLVPDGILKKYAPPKLKKKEFSCSTFMIYLGVKKKYPLNHHNIIFANDYKKNVMDIFYNKKSSDDFSIYVQNPSVTDATLAPEGKSSIYILVPTPNNDSGLDWKKLAPIYRKRVFAILSERTELKDIESQIEVEKIITPEDWEHQGNIYKGATFNLSHKFSQLLYLRPRNKFEELEHCYLVGGGTHPGSGLPTIYESARISSNLLCDKYQVPYPELKSLYD